MRTISLALVLAAFWLVLSGLYKPFLLTLGALTVIFTLLLANRMRIIDPEGHPIELLPRALTYLPWLIKEIIVSALSVSRIIWSPSLPISPTMTRVQVSQKTPLGVNIYANSITLTPGTITVKEEGGTALLVHALQTGGADDLEAGDMDRKVTAFEGAG
ncbi:MAG: Na+/H+ antiporter subunit E [Pseudomonadota bacterium]